MLKKSPNKNILESLISPFGLVLILTFFTFGLVLLYGLEGEFKSRVALTFEFWQNGFFGLLGFTLQMMMILVFGYALAIFKQKQFKPLFISSTIPIDR